jgi:hypothetical protein
MLSPEGNEYSNTNSNNYRDTGYSEDKSDHIIEKKDDVSDNKYNV